LNPLIDLLITLLITTFIVKEGLEFLYGAIFSLIDRNVEKLTKKVREISMNVKGVNEVHNVKVRNYGGYYIINMNILTIKEAHKVAHNVEGEVKRNVPRVLRVHIHLEPVTEHE